MGYAYYEINGKPCGYSVAAKCEEPGCDADIDRGLSFLCGRTPGGDEIGCGGYFCDAHLNVDQRCPRCAVERACKKCKGEGVIEVDGELDDCECMK